MKHGRRIKIVIPLWIVVFLVAALPVATQAGVPMLINYQGYLTDDSGNPLSGKQSLNFRLYSLETGGFLFWQEEQLVVVTDGVFNVKLGAVNLLFPSVFNIDTIYLEIQIFNADSVWETLRPRQQFTSSAFAVRAGNADMLEGYTLSELDNDYVNIGEADAVTSVMIADSSIGADDLADNSIGTAAISASAVGTTELADNAVTTNKLAGSSVSSNEVVDNSLTAADLAPNSVGSSEVIDNSLIAADLASNSVTASKIAAGAVGSSEILDGTVSANDLANDYVNATGDTMTGDLNIGGDISVSKSGGIGDYTATFESSGGQYAYAINAIANSTNYNALGLTLDVDSANSYAYGSRVDVDAPSSYAFGTYIDVDSYGSAHGLYANANSTDSYVYGSEVYSTAGSGSANPAYGFYGANQHSGTGDLYGIRSYNNHFGTSGDCYGLYTYLTGSDVGDAKGVYSETRKYSTDTDGTAYGGHFVGDNDRTGGDSYGVLGEATGSNGKNYGLYGVAKEMGNSNDQYGAYTEAHTSTPDTVAYGYYADVWSQGGSNGVMGIEVGSLATGDSDSYAYGMMAFSTNWTPSGRATGVMGSGHVNGGGDAFGIMGQAWAATGDAYAGYFLNDVHVSGTLSKAGGLFKIDHPLDPENRYLQHSFVESPDMMNVYNGNSLLDETGAAWVELPEYFEALNRDFRYQLTAIGAPGPNLFVAEEIMENRFKIAGGQAGMKVSWQVTGIRQDAWANDHRIEVEVDKRPKEVGTYLYPEGFGLDQTLSVEFARHPEMMQARLDAEQKHLNDIQE